MHSPRTAHCATLVLVLVLGCAAPRSAHHTLGALTAGPTAPARTSAAPDATDTPAAAGPPTDRSSDDEQAEPAPAATVAPEPIECAIIDDCQIVARHGLRSSFARRRGYFRSRAGLVASRHAWQEHGRPDETFFVEVSPSCAVEAGYYIASGREIWLRFVIGTRYEWSPFEVPDPLRFRPVGGGFFDDGAQIYDRDAPLNDDPPVDRASFRVCHLPPWPARSTRFFPEAFDAHGPFGRGEHGDLERARR